MLINKYKKKDIKFYIENSFFFFFIKLQVYYIFKLNKDLNNLRK